jgi:hypothetical protein
MRVTLCGARGGAEASPPALSACRTLLRRRGPLHRAGGGTICAAMMEFRPSVRRKAAGISLLGLGVVGLVLPFLQGFLFLALGLFVLRHQYLWAHRGMGWVAGRWPGAVGQVETMEARLLARWQLGMASLRQRARRLLGRA